MRQEIRVAIRSMLRAPSYALMVIGSLALGIAAASLGFAVVDAALFRPLAGLEDSERLVAVGMRDERGAPQSSYDDYVAAKERLRHLVTLAAQTPASFAISRAGGDAVTITGELVSGNYFETVGVRPVLGRLFGADGDRPPLREPVVVIGHSTWRRHFQADPAAVGRFVAVNGRPLQIVGIAPEGFHGVTGPENDIDLWLPIGLADLALRRNGSAVSVEDAGAVHVTYVGRLRPGVSVEQVQVAAAALTTAASGPRRPRVEVASLSRVGPPSRWLWVGSLALSLMALPLLVLAIACVNAGNLVLARVTQASAAWSVQLALGATRRRLLRQPLIEGLLLALPAAAGGVLLAGWALPFLPGNIGLDFQIDRRVAIFAALTALATPLAFGTLPASFVIAQTLGRRPGQGLPPAAMSRARSALLVGQIAASLALLGTGTQFVRTVRGGFGDGFTRGDTTLVAIVDADKVAFGREASDAFYAALLDGVRTVPGATGAVVVGGIRFAAGVPRFGDAAVWLPDDPPGEPRRSGVASIAGDRFDILGLSLVSGRVFQPDEHRAPMRAVVVNEAFARQHLAGSALGQTVRLGARDGYLAAIDAVVVGVVSPPPVDRDDLQPTVFTPHPLSHLPVRTLYVPFGDAQSMTAAMPAVRRVFREIDRRVPFTLTTLEEWRMTRSAPRRFTAVAVTVLGGVALLLAAAGLYAVGVYLVELRRREIGVRMAVGASASAVLAMMLWQALRTAAIGSIAGVALALAAAIVFRSRMYGTAMIDPAAFGAALAVLMMTLLAASALPARRAARVDPAEVLRSE